MGADRSREMVGQCRRPSSFANVSGVHLILMTAHVTGEQNEALRFSYPPGIPAVLSIQLGFAQCALLPLGANPGLGPAKTANRPTKLAGEWGHSQDSVLRHRGAHC